MIKYTMMGCNHEVKEEPKEENLFNIHNSNKIYRCPKCDNFSFSYTKQWNTSENL